MEFQESKTYANLQSAMDRELRNSTQYDIYSDKAREQGYIEIGNVFTTIARNELEHARIWLKQLNNGEVPSTEQNLASSIETETLSDIYRRYAQVAIEEGYNNIAALFNGVANIELNHSLEFQVMYENVVANTVFCKPDEYLWICMACGNILSGKCAPEICPVCGFPQGYYKILERFSF